MKFLLIGCIAIASLAVTAAQWGWNSGAPLLGLSAQDFGNAYGQPSELEQQLAFVEESVQQQSALVDGAVEQQPGFEGGFGQQLGFDAGLEQQSTFGDGFGQQPAGFMRFGLNPQQGPEDFEDLEW
ncbi:uncharacterized protein LOC117135045 [Drosophila busckii]|uniref:uncharacterized protein LOC117135045 n=1 Tax=Drosophila busckii TaxID=30019 RepID=UPI001432FDB9|nr:uncharacterized protein LOC117135045 [Drosophila busckii]